MDAKRKGKWTCSSEQRAKLEAALHVLALDYADYVSGRKDRRQYPMIKAAPKGRQP